MRNKALGLWVPLLLLAVTMLLNVYFSESLYKHGENIIHWAQQHESVILDRFFVFFTALVEPYFVVTFLFVWLTLFPHKFEASVAAVIILFNNYAFVLMKAYFNEPRPFWTSKFIKNIGYYCPKDFGSPSGHTEFAVFFILLLLIHFNKQRKLWPMVVGFVTVVFIMVSRMYLGGHSLDQVLFGFIVAASIAIMYAYGGIR
jgi:membrane-associated phospholipid phosphatase